MLTYLIDGYNLLYQITDLEAVKPEELEDQRDRLIKRLISFSAGRRFKFHLVFDTSRVRHGRIKYPGVRVDYASPSADAFIRDIISRNQRNKSLIIVSSDRKDIGNYAKICGIDWMTSQQFWQNMTSHTSFRKTGLSDPENDKKPPTGWSSQDDAWLRRVFED